MASKKTSKKTNTSDYLFEAAKLSDNHYIIEEYIQHKYTEVSNFMELDKDAKYICNDILPLDRIFNLILNKKLLTFHITLYKKDKYCIDIIPIIEDRCITIRITSSEHSEKKLPIYRYILRDKKSTEEIMARKNKELKVIKKENKLDKYLEEFNHLINSIEYKELYRDKKDSNTYNKLLNTLPLNSMKNVLMLEHKCVYDSRSGEVHKNDRDINQYIWYPYGSTEDRHVWWDLYALSQLILIKKYDKIIINAYTDKTKDCSDEKVTINDNVILEKDPLIIYGDTNVKISQMMSIANNDLIYSSINRILQTDYFMNAADSWIKTSQAEIIHITDNIERMQSLIKDFTYDIEALRKKIADQMNKNLNDNKN